MATKNREPWYLSERARALALVYLTRRRDLAITHEPKEFGLDYLVDIADQDRPGIRRFGLELTAVPSPTTEEQANRQLLPTMQRLHRLGELPFPACLFFFTMKDNQGYFTWIPEPVVGDDEEPKLVRHEDAHCRKLTDKTVDQIVASVNSWYDALFKALSP